MTVGTRRGINEWAVMLTRMRTSKSTAEHAEAAEAIHRKGKAEAGCTGRLAWRRAKELEPDRLLLCALSGLCGALPTLRVGAYSRSIARLALIARGP